jgi:N-acetylmuramoyl-L-alanine amidase
MDTNHMKPLAVDDVRYIFVHTEGSFTGQHGTAKSINDYHRAPPPKGRGWLGGGYHAVIEEDGRVVPMRPRDRQGAGVEGVNAHSWHICVTGNGDKSPFNPAQMASLIPLLWEWCVDAALPASFVLGHREVNRLIRVGVVNEEYRTPKSCPGTRVDMKAIRFAVAGFVAPKVPPAAGSGAVPRGGVSGVVI